MKTKNLKDTITTICGILIALCGTVGAIISQGVNVPHWVISTSIVVATLSGAILAYLSGKNNDGSKKTEKQIEDQNKSK